MIMKNEAANLARSLAPVAAWVDEMVVVDTGSTDQSRALAQDLGARVFDFQWINDFSAARNFGLAQAATDFILWLDGDNSVSPEGLAEFKSHLRIDGEFILLATEVVIPQGDRLWQKRVFPNRPGQVYFEGQVHEQLIYPPHWPAMATGVEISHWGYSDGHSARQKGERNLELLLNCPETQSGDFYWLYQTGRTLANLRRYEEALKWLQRAAEAKTTNRPLLGHAYILLAQTQSRLGQHQDAEKTARQLVEIEPGYGPGYYYLGKLLYDLGQLAEAGQNLETALILGTGDLVWGADQKACDFKASFLLGRIWIADGRPDSARQAFSLARDLDPRSPEPIFALAEMALAEGEVSLAQNWLENVLSLAPGHRRAVGLLARLKGGGHFVSQ